MKFIKIAATSISAIQVSGSSAKADGDNHFSCDGGSTVSSFQPAPDVEVTRCDSGVAYIATPFCSLMMMFDPEEVDFIPANVIFRNHLDDLERAGCLADDAVTDKYKMKSAKPVKVVCFDNSGALVGAHSFLARKNYQVNRNQICLALTLDKNHILDDLSRIVLPGIYMKNGFIAADASYGGDRHPSDLYVRGPSCSYRYKHMDSTALAKFTFPPEGFKTRTAPNIDIPCISDSEIQVAEPEEGFIALYEQYELFEWPSVECYRSKDGGRELVGEYKDFSRSGFLAGAETNLKLKKLCALMMSRKDNFVAHGTHEDLEELTDSDVEMVIPNNLRANADKGMRRYVKKAAALTGSVIALPFEVGYQFPRMAGKWASKQIPGKILSSSNPIKKAAKKIIRPLDRLSDAKDRMWLYLMKNPDAGRDS